MKTLRVLSMLVCLLAISAGFVSCSDDDNSGGVGSLVGTWEIIGVELYFYDSSGELVEMEEYDDDGSRFTLYEDGTGVEDGSYFEWSLSSNQLTLFDGGENIIYTVVSLTSTELVVETTDRDENGEILERMYCRRLN